MIGNDALFIQALETKNLDLLKQIPKSDLHNHGPLGSRLSALQKHTDTIIPKPPTRFADIIEMNTYLFTQLRPFILSREGMTLAMTLAFEQAKEDGVHKLEMSFDCTNLTFFDNDIATFTQFLNDTHQKVAPEIEYNPEIGFARDMDVAEAEKLVIPLIESGYFKSIDLYGNELIRSADAYLFIYSTAEKYKMKLKAHSGEFGDAKSVRQTIEMLHLNEVQHGVSIASDKEIMNWVKNNNIRLNVCPTSNIILGRTNDLANHQARVLYDNGVLITINSDDIMLFDQSVSEEYMNLFEAGLFTASELNDIREQGLN